jgi:hypothetical protein
VLTAPGRDRIFNRRSFRAKTAKLENARGASAVQGEILRKKHPLGHFLAEGMKILQSTRCGFYSEPPLPAAARPVD